MLFCGCVVAAGLLRECAWTGVLEMGCWDAADWSCETRGSCQVVVLSRWLQTHNKSEHIDVSHAAAAWCTGKRTVHFGPQTCFTCTTRCARYICTRWAKRVRPLTGTQAVRPCALMNETSWNHSELQNELELFSVCLQTTSFCVIFTVSWVLLTKFFLQSSRRVRRLLLSMLCRSTGVKHAPGALKIEKNLQINTQQILSP